MTLPNDVAPPSAVVILTSADVTLDTDGRDCSFKVNAGNCVSDFLKCPSFCFMKSRKKTVSEIKDFSDAHIGCTNPQTMPPAKFLCTFPYMIILNGEKRHAFPGARG